MSNSELTPDVRAFLADHIESYEHLEILIVLHARRGEWCTLDSIAVRLPIPPGSVDQAVEHLLARSLLQGKGEGQSRLFKYDPTDATLANAVDQLARAYQDTRLEVMKLMTANAVARLRIGALRAFTDAFLVGRRKKDG